MGWIVLAVLSPMFYAIANILDSNLTNRIFKNVWTLSFYSTAFNILFLPIVLLVQIPSLPPINLLPYFVLIGILEIAYLYPYYKALEQDDTSIIAALFSLGKIFVPVLAFFLVGERLQISQQIGFLIIISSSAALTFNHKQKLKLNRAFFYMAGCSFLLALELVIYKYLFATVTWSTGFVWTTALSALFGLVFLISPKTRHDVRAQFSTFLTNSPLFFLQELFSFGGTAIATYVITLIPVTISAAISSSLPFFVLFYALVLGKKYPHIFREQVDRKNIFKKIFLFATTIIGIMLVL